MKLRMYLRGLGIGIAVTAVVMSYTASSKNNNKLSDAEIMSRAKELGMVMEDTTLKSGLSDETEKVPTESVDGTEEGSKESSEESSDEENSKDEESQLEGSQQEAEKKDAEAEIKPEDNKDVKENQTEKKEVEAAEVKPEDNKDAKENQTEKKEVEAAEIKPEDNKDVKENQTEKKDAEAEKKADDNKASSTGQFKLNIAGGISSFAVCTLLEKGGVIKSASEFDKYICAKGYDRKITTGEHVIPEGADFETIAKILVNEK